MYTPEPDALDLPPEDFADIRVEVRLDYDGRRALVMLTAAARARLICDRTLEPFWQPVEGQYTLLFAPPEAAAAADDESDEDIRVLHPQDQALDLTEPVRDTILLSLPLRRVAPGAEEKPIPTRLPWLIIVMNESFKTLPPSASSYY